MSNVNIETGIMLVNIGKGIELPVDVNKLTPQYDDTAMTLDANPALAHIVYIGLRNVLMDSHASVTKESNPNDMVEAATAMAQKKLDALHRGEVRVQSTREGDPVRAEAIAMAIASLRPRIKVAGKHLKSEKHPDGITPAQLREAAIKTITPELLAKAKVRVEENRAVDVGTLADIGL